MFPADPGDQEHRAGNGREEDRGAAVRFDKDHSQDNTGDGSRKNDTFPERLHLAKVPVAIPGQRNDERQGIPKEMNPPRQTRSSALNRKKIGQSSDCC